MAEENINNIVNKEAIQQLIDLGKQLSETKAEMDELIASSLELQKNLSNSSNFKDTAKAASDLNAASEKLNQTNSARLNIERQIKASGDEMANAVRSEEEAMEILNKVLKEHVNNTYEAASNVNRLKSEQEQLNLELKELKKSYKDGAISREEFDGRMLDSTVAIQENKVALSEANRELKSSVKEDQAVINSMSQKSLRLGRLRDLYRDLTDEERNNAEVGGVLQQAINSIDEEMKGLDLSIGNSQRMIGNYATGFAAISKQGNTFSKVLTGVTRSTLMASTANSTLARSILSVGTALRGIPGLGWVFGIASVLVTIGTLLSKHIKLERELTAEQKIRKKVSEDLQAIQTNVIKSTQETVTKLKLYTSELSKTKSGSKEWESIVKEIAKITGENYNDLVKFPDKIKDITNAWINQYVARVKAEELVKKVVEAEISATETLSNLQKQDEKERKKTLKSLGYEKEELDDILLIYKDIDRNKEGYYEPLRKGLTVLQRREEFENKILETSKEQSKEWLNQIKIQDLITESTNTTNNKKVKEQADFMMSIRKKIAEFEAETDEENLSLKILQLEKQMEEEVTKYGKTQTEKIEIRKRYNLEIEKLTKELSTKQAQAEMDVLNYTEKINQYRKENTTISNQELTDNLIKIQDQRLSNQIKALEKEKEKELGVLTAGSKEYLAVEEKYNKQSELLTLDSDARKKEIKKKSFDENLTNVRNQFKILENETTTQGIKTGKSEVEIQRELADQKIQLLEKERDSLDENLLGREEYALRVSELNKGIALTEKEKADAVIQGINRERQAREEIAIAAVDGFTSIGNALAQNIEDEKERVKIQQSLAMMQVLMNEGIAISQAVRLAFEGDPYTAIPRLIASTAAIATAMIMSISAITKAKSAYAEGTAFHRGGSALVGEGGQPELVQTPKGETFVVDKPSYFENLPIGTSVTPFSELKYSNSTDMSETNQLLKELNNKPTAVIDVSDKITNYIQTKLGKTAIINRKFKV